VRTWPVVLRHDAVVLRPLRRRDVVAWNDVQTRNREWLRRWEATSPDGGVPPTFAQMVASLRRQAREGRAMPFVVEVDGRLRGQVTVSSIAWGAFRSGSVGYWIDQAVAGRGIVPCAVAMVTDHCVSVGMNRLEVNIRPENGPSLAVVRKLGLRQEGLRQRLLHIDGDWRDHLSFAVTAEEVVGGLHTRLHAGRPGATADHGSATRT